MHLQTPLRTMAFKGESAQKDSLAFGIQVISCHCYQAAADSLDILVGCVSGLGEPLRSDAVTSRSLPCCKPSTHIAWWHLTALGPPEDLSMGTGHHAVSEQ